MKSWSLGKLTGVEALKQPLEGYSVAVWVPWFVISDWCGKMGGVFVESECVSLRLLSWLKSNSVV